MPMYNLIEYINNYFDPSRSLWLFKRHEAPAKYADIIKSSLTGVKEADSRWCT